MLELSALADPSTPRPTGAPTLSRSGTRQVPEESFMLETGQCATPDPAAPRRAISWSVK